MQNIFISIVIPVFNSNKNLDNLLNNLILVLKENYESFEIVLIDDESKDDSWEIIKKFSAKYNFIKSIKLRKNVGQHNAIFAGLSFAKGKYVITLDDDGQNSPNDIIILVNKIKKGFDVVYANFNKKRHNIFRKLGSSFNNIIASFYLTNLLN